MPVFSDIGDGMVTENSSTQRVLNVILGSRYAVFVC